MPFFRKKGIFPAFIVTIAVALCVVIVHFTGSNPLSNAIRTVFVPFQNGASYISARIDGMITFLWEAQGYKEENERLTQEIQNIKASTMDAEKYKEENERLHELLDLDNNIEEYDTVAARVIAYSSNNWYDTIEINKGKTSGIIVGDCVVTSNGVVGRVSEVGPNWATVSTVLNVGNATGIRVSRTGDIGVIEGDGALCLEGICKVSFIENNSGLIIGDILETSGSGGIYPEGYIVGSITEVKTDNTGKLSTAIVKPSVDFANLREVLVIQK